MNCFVIFVRFGFLFVIRYKTFPMRHFVVILAVEINFLRFVHNKSKLKRKYNKLRSFKLGKSLCKIQGDSNNFCYIITCFIKLRSSDL